MATSNIIDKAETGSLESTKDGRETETECVLTASGHATCNNSDSPPGHPSPVQSPVSSFPATPEVSAPSSHLSPAPGFSASFNPFSIPHPKKFSAVNINKTFFQKTSTSSGTASATSSHVSTVKKSGSPAPRPTTQSTSSHSRLVTAKLTSTAQLSTTTGPGWSRPSSATPPVSTTPSNSSTLPPPPTSVPAAPQFPHVGKVIQPQPRNATLSSSSMTKKDRSSARPAWGNAKPRPVTSSTDTAARDDFPTAAEVAHGRGTKLEEHKPEDLTHAGQVAAQEADAFRGVHLDPNAHHWDEMEEDDDNFLPNVIEFGDGRQYKIAPNDAIQPSANNTSGGVLSAESPGHVSNEHVRQEDRFADDYDRSWPRSKRSPTALSQDLPSRSSRRASVSPTSSQPRYSPVEGPRVLFNERSNRLEPYSSPHPPNRHGVGPSQHGFSRRNVYTESSLSAESRSNRGTPPHTPTHPVQLLQKAVESNHKLSPQLPRREMNDPMGRRNSERGGVRPSGGYGGHFGQNRTRVREGAIPTPQDGRHAGDGWPRRSSGAQSDDLRPDTSHVVEVLPHQSQPPSVSSQSLSKTETSALQADDGDFALSPDLSRNSAVSGVTIQGSVLELDIEGVHKATMHITAERARQRRQLEEEEREKEKERARKKAAELEAQMRLQEESKKQAQEAAAVKIIQEAVGASQHVDAPALKPSESLLPSVHPVATKISPSPGPHSQTDHNLNVSLPTVLAGELVGRAEQADSWRSKLDHPLHPTISSLPPVVYGSDEAVSADEHLEVVDFSDLAKFVGAEENPSITSSRSDRPFRLARPVASDFFEEPSPRNGSTDVLSPTLTEHPVDPTASLETSRQLPREGCGSQAQSSPSQETGVFANQKPSSAINGPFPPASGYGHPSPTAPLYRHNKIPAPFREAPMSALDDVMSRIKGALDNMQVDSGKDVSLKDGVDWRSSHAKSGSLGAMPRAPPKEGKWLPPALRTRHSRGQEAFDTSGCEPPRSPQPALTALVVNLPRIPRAIEPVPKRQLRDFEGSSGRARLDILSWDPPVKGMNMRDLSLNDFLFGRGFSTRSNKFRCRVALPKAPTLTPRQNGNSTSSFLTTSGSSNRLKGLDDLPTWRRGPPPACAVSQPGEFVPVPEVVSCSPPPEPPMAPSKSTKGDDALVRAEASQVRPRTQPKMPVGSAVGFYRDPGSSTDETKATVNFTVNSELDESTLLSPSPHSILLSSTATTEARSEVKDSATGNHVDGVHSKDSKSHKLALVTQVENKSSEESAERSLVTPASTSFSTPWTKSPLSFSTKDSPARGPDPEHLKAVWSQAADKEPLSAVNSLEGIADDLTALPFTIQDVKSEDGETPPPTSSVAPSKISLHEVTRAFQRVPSSNNTSRPPLSPAAASGPITRPSSFNYLPHLQHPGASMQQHFAAFPSPMLAHSPSPTLLFPPAAPSPPRVPTSSHSQSMSPQGWMPIQTSQNHSGIARPLASPYPAQIMAYPPPNGVPTLYSVSSAHPTSANGTIQPRPRTVQLMSPIMHAPAPANLPMYGGSPILMPAPPMAPGLRPYPPTRTQVRPDGMSGAPLVQQPPQPTPHQPMYTNVPPIVYNRQW